MSAHYSHRQSSGCIGCAIALALAAVPVGFALYGAVVLVRWVME